MLATLAALAAAAPAAAGAALDPTFGSAGRVVTPLGSFAMATSVALHPDGTLLVGGQVAGDGGVLRPLLVRYDVDGEVDRTFADGGVLVLDGEAGSATVALRADGRIVVATGGRLLRFLEDGTPDRSFGDGGSVAVPSFPLGAYARLLVQPDGGIVLAGSTPFAGLPRELRLLRFRPDGRPDATFGRSGAVAAPADWVATAAALAPDGKLVVAGSWMHPDKRSSADRLPVELVAARFTRAGAPDRTFGRGGVVRLRLDPAEAVTTAVAVQRDGRVLVGGRGSATGPRGGCCAAVWRLRADGTLDRAFGEGGKAVTAGARLEPGRAASALDGVQAIAVGRGGRIVVTSLDEPSPRSRFGLARFTAVGRRDARFGSDGAVTTSFGGTDRPWALALRPDGGIVVAGSTGPGSWLQAPRAIALARYVAPLCVVPRLRGRTLAGAAVALRSSGCAPGRVRRVFSSDVRRGRVVAQQHPALARLPEDSSVGVVVSRGRRR